MTSRQGETRYDFFLAHAGPDEAVAGELYDLLSPHARPYLASRCMELGADWGRELSEVQRRSRVTVVLISPNTPRAFYQRAEIARAIDLAREDPASHGVIPIFLEGFSGDPRQEVPFGIDLKHGIRLSESTDLASAAEQLLRWLRGKAVPGAAGADPSRDGAAPRAQGALPVSPVLHGRERELAEIDRILDHLSATDAGIPIEAPQLILLAGESGVGKSALAKRAIVRASELGFGVASVVCEPFHEGMSFFPVREVIRQFVRERSITDEVGRWYGSDSVQARMAHLAERHEASPSERRDALVATFVNVLLAPYRERAAGDARPRPRLVFIDDLDGIDAGSADALLCFLSRAREGPVLVLGAYRKDLVVKNDHPLRRVVRSVRRAGDRASVLELRPLPREAIPKVAEAILGARCSFPSTFHQRLFDETEGNPLFLREILRSLARREDRLQLRNGQWTLKSEPAAWSIPKTVEEVIGARLDLLDPDLRKDLEIAAVIGRQFSFPVLRRLTERREEDLLQELEALLESDVVDEAGDEGETFEFCHGKIRDVLYESIPTLRRRRIHGRVAEALESLREGSSEDRTAVIGEHLYLAGKYEDAGPHLLEAARSAMGLHSGFEAATLYEKARDCGDRRGFPPGEAPLAVRLEEIEALKLSNDYERARRACLELMDERVDPLIRGWAFNHLGDIHWTLGESEEATEAHETAERIARKLEDRELLLETVADLCELHDREAERFAGLDAARVERHRARSSRYLEEQRELAEAIGDREAKSRAWRNLAKSKRRQGELEVAIEEYERALEVREPSVPTHSVLISYAKTLRFVGRHADALKAVERVLEWSTQTGARRSLAIALQYRGILAMEMDGGGRNEAKADLERALELHEEIGYARGRRETAILLGEWHLLEGEKDDAMKWFRYALDSEEEDPEALIGVIAAQLRAMSELQRENRLLETWGRIAK
jgi:predicted ATPase